MLPNKNLLIHELAEQAKTTVRTIRYYTDEGLLPQPAVQGKYAYYNQNHLNRLELIRGMKDAYLPLREIRQIINSLSDDEVWQRLQKQPSGTSTVESGLLAERSGQASGKNALEYIARLMDEQSAHRPPGTAVPAPVAQPRVHTPSIGKPPAGLKRSHEEETWQRIQLAAGVELSVRQPGDPDTTIQIQQLITFARGLFA